MTIRHCNSGPRPPPDRRPASGNTIVNDDGVLTAYNTDYSAVAALRRAGFTRGTVVARNEVTGRALADLAGFTWQSETGSTTADLLVNATPIGMVGSEQADVQSFEDATIAAARTVFDVVAFPSETPLVRAARSAGRAVITGAEVIALQAAEQFALYTGVRPTPEQVARASAFSRA